MSSTMSSTKSPRHRLVLKWLCVAVLSDLLIYFCYRHTLIAPDALEWNAWAFSDWLINYSGGFVRRGLAGHLIGLFAAGRPAAPIVNLIVFANFTALIFATSLLLVLSRPLGAFAAVLIMLIPGGVWSMQLDNELYYRKELLFYVYIALICLIYLAARRTGHKKLSCLLDVLNCGLIGLFSFALSFVHEAFLFIGAVPSMVILYWTAGVRRPAWRTTAPLLYGAVMVALFLVLLAFEGDRTSAQAIWQSLNPADRALISDTGDMAGGISAIGWGPVRELAETLIIIFKGTAWYYLLAVAASLLYLLATARFFCTDRDGKGAPAPQYQAWAAKIFTLCIVAIAPLFILGADWGRWIVAVNMMTVPLICAGEFQAPLPLPPVLDPGAIFKRIRSARYLGFACGMILVLVALTFRIPECCLAGSGDGLTTMESQLFASASQALLHRNERK